MAPRPDEHDPRADALAGQPRRRLDHHRGAPSSRAGRPPCRRAGRPSSPRARAGGRDRRGAAGTPRRRRRPASVTMRCGRQQPGGHVLAADRLGHRHHERGRAAVEPAVARVRPHRLDDVPRAHERTAARPAGRPRRPASAPCRGARGRRRRRPSRDADGARRRRPRPAAGRRRTRTSPRDSPPRLARARSTARSVPRRQPSVTSWPRRSSSRVTRAAQ